VDATRDTAAAEAGAFWSGVARGASLGGSTGRCAERVTRLDDLFGWYVHDALIHVTAPHGLEQSSGAAWGVRDVCQGPAELFVATRNTAPLRELVLRVYARQRRRGGDWPQWFMFDRYREVQAPDSHGDVIHWPMKLLCDYVEATGDLSILDEPVPWADDTTLATSGAASTILAHTEAQLDRIEADTIPGTVLPVFAGGDWEDTLQPVDPEAAQRMVSSWTVALAYQTLRRYRVVCERAGLGALAARLDRHADALRWDFTRHLVPDGVVTGLAHFRPDGVEYLLHPRDARTGVSYRLLPMTRGIIAGLFTPDQAVHHAGLVERHLLFPDGVRLQDRPMPYRGGPSTVFRRAESAASFGREVGLQYVHAHIRYVEAMATLGRAEDAFRGLLAVCPILLDTEVPSALPRQANAYFSSSDAAFRTRVEASRRFELLRDGRVGVKGGWRVYSSGPGIFINQLVSNVLGLREHYEDVVFDPVLPAEADGLTFDMARDGRRVRYRYRLTGSGLPASGIRVNGRQLAAERRGSNPYRDGGLAVTRVAFDGALDRPDNLVEIEA
jgi:cellobiose phosphorylase